MERSAESTRDPRNATTKSPAAGVPTQLTLPPGRDGVVRRVAPIAGYEILGMIGEGGMGVVYEAQESRLGRRVALKLIRPGFMNERMLRRFEYEATLLARLDHPGVARIYHADIFNGPAGPQPYFAMELIDGQKLDEYLNKNRPTLKQRQLVELFHEICQAVNHAHAKGVVHRDLKPSNILITRDGRPKVLDFGVARAIDADIVTTTLHTESGQMIGTLPYMAPEQAAGKVDELDTASDVYALGVIGYELFSGRMPYLLEGRPFHEAVRVICDEEPSRLSSIDKSLRGDLETIVQKALEKDKTRRYPTAGDLAADVKRHLDYEPITARPPSSWYQFRKFARRNKVAVGGAAAVVLALTFGVIASTYFAFKANRERAQAERRRDEAQDIASFMTDLFAGADPDQAQGRDVTARELVDAAAMKLDSSLGKQVLRRAALHRALANVYVALGQPRAAAAQAQASYDAFRGALNEDDVDLLESAVQLASAIKLAGDPKRAAELQREALARAKRRLGPDDPLTLRAMNNLAETLTRTGQMAEAEALFRDCWARRRRVLGEGHIDTFTTWVNIAGVCLQTNRPAEAEPVIRAALERYTREVGPNHSRTLTTLTQLAATLKRLGRLPEALPFYREAFERRRAVLGADHAKTLLAENNLGWVMFEGGDAAGAEPILRDALRGRRIRLGDDHEDTLLTMRNLGIVLESLDRNTDAERAFREAWERGNARKPNDEATMLSGAKLAEIIAAQGRLHEAVEIFGPLTERSLAALGPNHRHSIGIQMKYGQTLMKLERFAEAEPILIRAARAARTARDRSGDDVIAIASAAADCLERQSKSEPARALRAEFGLAAAAPLKSPITSATMPATPVNAGEGR